MTQSLPEAPAQGTRETTSAGERERDRVAWNLPRAVAHAPRGVADRNPLDWEAFSATFFPGRRRHDLDAIVAYGAYKKSGIVDKRSTRTADGVATATRSADAWEDEGGATL